MPSQLLVCHDLELGEVDATVHRGLWVVRCSQDLVTAASSSRK